MDYDSLGDFFEKFKADKNGKVSRDAWLAFFGSMFDQEMAPMIADAVAANGNVFPFDED